MGVIRKFDTKVQYLKYKVLREVARLAWEDKLLENLIDIPKRLVPGNEPTMRCCVYKEREIVRQRVRLAEGKNADGSPNTARSLNPVPCVYVTDDKNATVKDGILADVAPSILKIMGLQAPADMSGTPLI